MGFKENYAKFADWLESQYVTFVDKLEDFPDPVGGVITLVANQTYFITTTVDLLGNRLVAGNNTVLIGGSSENCILKSTGLDANTALLSSTFSLPMRNITLTHGLALNLDATGNATAALDWTGVNFLDCTNVGTIKTYSNFIMQDCALLNSAGMVFDGTFGTIGGSQCLFSGRAGQTTMSYLSTLTVTRRIRWVYSSFVASGGATAINVSTSASIPIESYILDTVNFSGGATYTAGVQHDDNKSLWSNCKGVENSAEIAQMYWINNTTATTIATINVFVKANGTSTANAINQKFTHTNNRLTYTGGLTRDFIVSAVVSMQDGNAQLMICRIAKNGTTLANSESQATTSQTNRSQNVKTQTIVSLAPNDYIEIFITNGTSTSAITVTELNVIVEALN